MAEYNLPIRDKQGNRYVLVGPDEATQDDVQGIVGLIGQKGASLPDGWSIEPYKSPLDKVYHARQRLAVDPLAKGVAGFASTLSEKLYGAQPDPEGAQQVGRITAEAIVPTPAQVALQAALGPVNAALAPAAAAGQVAQIGC